MNKKRIFKLFAFIGAPIVVLLLGFIFRDTLVSFFFRPTDSGNAQQGRTIEDDPSAATPIAEHLTVPWSVVVLPDGDFLVAEREGALRRIGQYETSITVDDVVAQGEGGLLGVTLDPQYEENSYIYTYTTTEQDNRVTRYTYDGRQLSDGHVVLEGIPKSGNHNGGRIAFGPDNLLYIGTGDAGSEALAQDTASLAGKILRIHKDGAVPEDNPFDSPVYSLGHRNVQGIVWDDDGRLWSTEHGRSGSRTGLDEINLIEKGGNYGWPQVEGDETHEGMLSPVLHSGETTWAPGSLAYVDDHLFFGGLRGQSLYQVRIEGDSLVNLKAHYAQQFGRIRDVIVDGDDNLIFSTSNKDGRGVPSETDDRVVRIQIESLISR